ESEKEGRIAKAIAAYRGARFTLIRKTAEAFNVGYTTLHRRLNGSTTRAQAHIAQQLLTPAEGRVVV
ncbi:hypothetical protein DFH27DRAFT_488611, partial [Peziza echinospora]